jgi:hypothetical protein
VLVWRFFVRTERGQLMERIALTGNAIGQDRVTDLVNTVLNVVTVVSVIVAVVLVGFIALVRRRFRVALAATLLVAGANLTTQVLKQVVITRPEFGVDGELTAVGNSFPSGHTTVAASVAVALVLVVPPAVRGFAAVAGAGFAALTGVATLSAGWHRPSDAIGALLIVGGWAAGVSFLLVLTEREEAVPGGHPVAATLLGLAAVGFLGAAFVAFRMTEGVLGTAVDDLSRRQLFTAYAGGAAGIAGTAALVLSLISATVHRVSR